MKLILVGFFSDLLVQSGDLGSPHFLLSVLSFVLIFWTGFVCNSRCTIRPKCSCWQQLAYGLGIPTGTYHLFCGYEIFLARWKFINIDRFPIDIDQPSCRCVFFLSLNFNLLILNCRCSYLCLCSKKYYPNQWRIQKFGGPEADWFWGPQNSEFFANSQFDDTFLPISVMSQNGSSLSTQMYHLWHHWNG